MYRPRAANCQARFPFKRNRLRCVRCINENRKKRLCWQAANHGCHCFDRAFLLAGACVCCVKFSRNKRKRQRQPIGMLGRSSGNRDWLLANTSAGVSCGFRLRNAHNASDCVWMETGLQARTVEEASPVMEAGSPVSHIDLRWKPRLLQAYTSGFTLRCSSILCFDDFVSFCCDVSAAIDVVVLFLSW